MMKRIFSKFKQKIISKNEEPPPYVVRRSFINNNVDEPVSHETQEEETRCDVIDLLANCKIQADDNSESEAEYAEIQDMGIWHSTPLPGRHKSKVSLSWVLKENLDGRVSREVVGADENRSRRRAEVSRYQRHNQNYNDNDLQRKCKRSVAKSQERVVGRNEYSNYKFNVNSASVDYLCGQDTCSEDTSVFTMDNGKRRHRHKHRRRKTRPQSNSGKFGYDITDLDYFLSGASIDQPGNIPVVVAYPTTLYQTQNGSQLEMELPLGTVVNAVFKNKLWLYVQTPHGHEGYVTYSACLPLGILPRTNSQQKKTPCWESSTDIYPRPCGNLTDTEKEQLRGRTKSESRYRAPNERRNKYTKSLCGEEEFDNLYLKTKSFTNLNKYDEVWNIRKGSYRKRKTEVCRQTLLVVNKDFIGNSMNNALSVHQGDVVILIQGSGIESDVDSEWFYVKRRDGKQGFIPAEIAGHGSAACVCICQVELLKTMNGDDQYSVCNNSIGHSKNKWLNDAVTKRPVTPAFCNRILKGDYHQKINLRKSPKNR